MPPVSKVTPLPTKASGPSGSLRRPPAPSLALGRSPPASRDGRRPTTASPPAGLRAPSPAPRRAARPCRASFISASPSTSTSTPCRRRACLRLVRQRRLGIDDVGRLGDEIAGEEMASADAALGLQQLLGPLGIGAAEGQALQRRLVVLALLGAVLGEAVGAQQRRRTPSPPRIRPAPPDRPPAHRRRPGRRPCRCRRAPHRPGRLPPAAAAHRSRPALPNPSSSTRVRPERPGARMASVWSFLPRNRLASIARRSAPSRVSSSRCALGLICRSSRTPTTTTPLSGNSSAAKATFMNGPFV